MAERSLLYVNRIIRVYRQATAAELDSGLEWYAGAEALARSLDPDDVRRAAAVIAVLSPQTSWPSNVALAKAAYAGEPLRCLGGSARKAQRLVAGEPPESVVSGPKVTAFWHAILGEPGSVTLDRHAVAVCVGDVLDSKVTEAVLLYGGRTAMVDAYTEAARLAAVSPAAMQAVTWLVWRRLANAGNSRRGARDY